MGRAADGRQAVGGQVAWRGRAREPAHQAGYLLNGNDMDSETNPLEAGLGWVVKLARDFIGRDALARIGADGVRRKMVGLEIEGTLTIRNGYRIYRNGKEIGRVTSGPLSASLIGRNCGLGYVATADAAIGTEVEVDIAGQAHGDAWSRCRSARRVKEEPKIRTWSPYASALQRLPRLGGSRGGREGRARHRHLGFRSAQPGRHPERVAAQGRRLR